MTRVLEVLALGCGAALLQGAVAGFVSPWWIPDLSLLVVMGLAVYWRSTAGGLVLAMVLGFVTDLLSGSLLGQHALLRMAAFGATRAAGRRGMRTGPAQAVFAAVLTLGHVLALALLTSFFADSGGVSTLRPGPVAAQALVNALVAPAVVGAVRRLSDTALEEEGGRRLMPLQPRKWGS